MSLATAIPVVNLFYFLLHIAMEALYKSSHLQTNYLACSFYQNWIEGALLYNFYSSWTLQIYVVWIQNKCQDGATMAAS